MYWRTNTDVVANPLIVTAPGIEDGTLVVFQSSPRSSASITKRRATHLPCRLTEQNKIWVKFLLPAELPLWQPGDRASRGLR